MSAKPIISAIHITSRSRFGLSNRIRGLAGYYALSKIYECDLLYSWETDASCPGLIQDVFSAIPVGLPVPVETLPSDPKALMIGTCARPEMPTHCGSEPDKTFFCHAEQRADKKVFDWHVEEFYRQLRPSDSVVKRVTDFWQTHVPEGAPTLGMHVRRTDMVDHRRRLGLEPLQMEGIHGLADAFLRKQPSGHIMLACDNPESLERVRGQLGERVHHLEHAWILENRTGSEDAQIQARLTTLYDAMCDLWMLSQCDQIAGTSGSSFSQFAGTWGQKYVAMPQ